MSNYLPHGYEEETSFEFQDRDIPFILPLVYDKVSKTFKVEEQTLIDYARLEKLAKECPQKFWAMYDEWEMMGYFDSWKDVIRPFQNKLASHFDE